MYSTIGPQTSVKKGLFSSLHGLLISLRGLKKVTTWSQILWTARSAKISNAQRSVNEFLLAVIFLGLRLHFSWSISDDCKFIHSSHYSSNLWSRGHSFQTRGVKSMAHEAGQKIPPPLLKKRLRSSAGKQTGPSVGLWISDFALLI